jgi:hypothetical protein
MQNKIKKKIKRLDKPAKIDVQSIFSEDSLEFNSYEDEREVIADLLYSHDKKFLTTMKESKYD